MEDREWPLEARMENRRWRIAAPNKSPFLRFAEIMGAFGHFVEHGSNLLPFRVELLELCRADVAGIEGMV